MEKTSHDQRASSDSVQEERRGRDTKVGLFLHNPELSMNNPSQAEIGQPFVPQLQFPYTYADPYSTQLYTAYGPHNMIQPHAMGPTAGRIPLPADIPEDGPIYVNAKQYHGILRRRQTRAKLEAQNKLVKNRKAYLHESRHQHALNRVRGSGGRFLSTKKDQVPPTSSQSNVPNSFMFGGKSYNECQGSEGGGDGDLQQQDGGRFPMEGGGGGGFVYGGGRQYYASTVR